MVVAALALSLRRAAWITPRIRDTLGVKPTLLIVLNSPRESLSDVALLQKQRGGNNHFPQPKEQNLGASLRKVVGFKAPHLDFGQTGATCFHGCSILAIEVHQHTIATSTNRSLQC